MSPSLVRDVVDLSHPLDDDTPVYPGDPVARFTPATTIGEHGYNVLHVRMGSQTGTHVDAPYHFLPDGARIDELPLKLFLGLAVIADVRGKAPHAAVTWADLQPVADRLGPGRMLLLHTGWDAHWGTERYLDRDHPHLTEDACRALVAGGAALVGIDSVNVDDTVGGGRPAHTVLLGEGIPVVEHLTGLAGLPDTGAAFTAVPVAVEGMATFPVRAFATLA